MRYVYPDRILCKGCQTPIVKMDPQGSHPTAMYAELLIKFDDNTQHLTPICKVCGQKASLDDAKMYYKEDLEQWKMEAKSTNQKLPGDWFTREPTGCEVYK